MRRSFNRLFIPALMLVGLISLHGQESSAYDQMVYNNLLKSKDALVSQQTELQAAYDATQKQIDELNAKLGRIDSYLKQVNSSLRDVDIALQYAKQ